MRTALRVALTHNTTTAHYFRLVGVRCKFCSHLPIRSMARAKGAVYYPKTLISVYQGMYTGIRIGGCSVVTNHNNNKKEITLVQNVGRGGDM
jgi:hypothetical protein